MRTGRLHADGKKQEARNTGLAISRKAALAQSNRMLQVMLGSNIQINSSRSSDSPF
jgi:hypothetical protein